MTIITFVAAIQAATAPVTPPPPPAPPWMPVERANPATGMRSVSASANAANGAGRLVVRCDKGQVAVVSIQYIPRERPTGGAQQPVSLAFDGSTPMGDNWELMGTGLIERADVAASTLASGVAHARQIRLHAVDGAGAATDLDFTGPATDAPIRRVVEACGFTLGQPFVRAPETPPSPAPAPAPR